MCKFILSQGVSTMSGYEATWDECDDILNCSMFLWNSCSLIACQLNSSSSQLQLLYPSYKNRVESIMCQQWTTAAILQVYIQCILAGIQSLIIHYLNSLKLALLAVIYELYYNFTIIWLLWWNKCVLFDMDIQARFMWLFMLMANGCM